MRRLWAESLERVAPARKRRLGPRSSDLVAPRSSRWGTNSVCAAPREKNRQRLGKDVEVVGERPVLYVEQVQSNALVEAQLAASAHLPQTGDARRHLEPVELPVFVAGHLFGKRRPRTDQAHLAPDDV